MRLMSKRPSTRCIHRAKQERREEEKRYAAQAVLRALAARVPHFDQKKLRAPHAAGLHSRRALFQSARGSAASRTHLPAQLPHPTHARRGRPRAAGQQGGQSCACRAEDQRHSHSPRRNIFILASCRAAKRRTRLPHRSRHRQRADRHGRRRRDVPVQQPYPLDGAPFTADHH